MKRKTLYLLMSLGVFALPAALGGCVSNRSEYCYSGLLLHYHYDLNPLRENLFGSDVNRLAILVYDENDRFYRMFTVDDPSRLGDDNLIHIDVPDGTWSVVTWGGDMSSFDMGVLQPSGDVRSYDYAASRGASLEDYRLWITDFEWLDDGSKLVTTNLSELYYGFVSGATSVTSTSRPSHIEVPMIHNNNMLSVRLTGLPEDFDGSRSHVDNITVTADMVNGRCRHDNFICDDAPNIHYAQTNAISSDATAMNVDLTVMRLFAHDDVSSITVSGSYIEHRGFADGKITIPIVPTIMQSPDFNVQEDLDRENHYEFAIDFNSTSPEVTISVNGWSVTPVIVDGL
jgi:hypothetical protein